MGTTNRLLGVAAAAAALASGCGGSDRPAEPERYALAPTRACLVALGGGLELSDEVDFVASTALGGAMVVNITTSANFVVVAFGEDRAEAARLEQAYREFAGASIPIDDVLQRTQNVVLVWNGPPTPGERDTVLGCLRAPE